MNINNLGLAFKAGACVFGDKVLMGLQKGRIHLIIVADSASANTKEKIYSKAAYYKVDIITVDYEDIKKLTPKNIKIIGISNINFKKLIQGGENENK
jgi:ribosomal protein L7Ae-like RNA K-turn-binding protein